MSVARCGCVTYEAVRVKPRPSTVGACGKSDSRESISEGDSSAQAVSAVSRNSIRVCLLGNRNGNGNALGRSVVVSALCKSDSYGVSTCVLDFGNDLSVLNVGKGNVLFGVGVRDTRDNEGASVIFGFVGAFVACEACISLCNSKFESFLVAVVVSSACYGSLYRVSACARGLCIKLCFSLVVGVRRSTEVRACVGLACFGVAVRPSVKGKIGYFSLAFVIEN